MAKNNHFWPPPRLGLAALYSPVRGRGQEISSWGQEILNFGSKIQQVALGFFKFWFFVGLGAGVNIFFDNSAPTVCWADEILPYIFFIYRVSQKKSALLGKQNFWHYRNY